MNFIYRITWQYDSHKMCLRRATQKVIQENHKKKYKEKQKYLYKWTNNQEYYVLRAMLTTYCWR